MAKFDYPEFETIPDDIKSLASYKKALEKLDSFTDILNEVGEGVTTVYDKTTKKPVSLSRKVALAITVWDLAIRYRDKDMIKLIYERKDGKPARTVNVVGDKDKPIEIHYTAVDAPKIVDPIRPELIDDSENEDAEFETDTIPFEKNGTKNSEA